MKTTSDVDDSVLLHKRLHITPFDPSLVDKFLNPSLRSVAFGISFHTIQTFPERTFGFVELPAMEADKLKKKFNGTTLRGVKVRIEDAKPEKKRKSDSMEKEKEEGVGKKKKVKTNQSKREVDVLAGVELPSGRKVKRGWKEVEPEGKRKKSAKKGESSDATVGRMKFKTELPANAAEPREKPKKNDGKKKQGAQTKRKTVIEEFGKTRKLTAQYEGEIAAKTPASFVDGIGWVDEDGNVVEAAPYSTRRRSQRVRGEALDPDLDHRKSPSQAVEADVDENEDNMQADPEKQSAQAGPSPTLEAEVVPATAAEPSGEALEEVLATDSTTVKEVHPLEALFKRPLPKSDSASKPKPTPIDTSFAFFTSNEAENDNGNDAGAARPPQTPFTKEDLEWRTIRSAAPTPDTAAIGRKFSFPFTRDADSEDEEADSEDESEDDDDDDERDVAVAGAERQGDGAEGAAPEEQREESNFRKWFFDNRGDLNRSWKKRRREERKSKRQRENKRVSRRIV